MSLALRYVAALALLGIVPAVAFVVGRGVPIVALAAVNSVIIAASLYLMWGSSDAAEEHGPVQG